MNEMEDNTMDLAAIKWMVEEYHRLCCHIFDNLEKTIKLSKLNQDELDYTHTHMHTHSLIIIN